MYSRFSRVGVAVALAASVALASPLAQTGDRPDPDAFDRIQDEGMKRSQVMDTLSYLTDVYGARLTNSPQIRAAGDWAVGRMKEWQLDNVRKETWGPFGRGWANERFVANVVAPTPWPLLAFPRAWTPGTNGAVTAEAVTAIIERDEDFSQWTGKLKGKIVLASKPQSVKAFFDAPGRRWTDSELSEMEQQQASTSGRPATYSGLGGEFARRRMQFFAREGVLAVLQPGTGVGDHGSVLVMGSDDQRKPDAPPTVAQIVVATEHYGRLARTL